MLAWCMLLLLCAASLVRSTHAQLPDSAAPPPAPPPPPPALPSWLVNLMAQSGSQLHDTLAATGTLQASNLYPRVLEQVSANLGMRHGQRMLAVPLAPLLARHLGDDALDALAKAVQQDMAVQQGTNLEHSTTKPRSGEARGNTRPEQQHPSFTSLMPDTDTSTGSPTQGATGAGSGRAHPSTLHACLHLLLASPERLNVSFAQAWELRYVKSWHVIAQARAIARGAGAADRGYADPHSAKLSGTRTAGTQATGGQPAGSRAGTNRGTSTQEHTGSSGDLESELQLLARLQSRLPRRLCFPLLRRLVVGALAWRWARDRGASWTEGVHRAAGVVLMQLYVAHRGAVARKGVVELFHVSKSGGTTFCHLAFLNGCSTQDFTSKGNCLVREFDDFPRWVSRAAHFSLGPPDARAPWYVNHEKLRNTVFCNRRRHFLKTKGWNMYSHEYTPVGGQSDPSLQHLCPDHVTVLQAREPVTRLTSHLKWVYGLYRQVEGADAGRYWPNTNSAHWLHMTPAVADNYYVRSLLGEAAYHTPHGWVDEHATHNAALVASQFDVLLLLEDSDASQYHMRMGLGWAHGLHDVHVRMGGAWGAAADRMGDDKDDTMQAEGRKLVGGDGEEATTQLLGTRQLLVGAVRSAAVQSTVRGSTADGIPPDLATMLDWNKWDRRLYVYMSWISRLDSVLFAMADVLLGGDPAKGMGLLGRVLPASNSTAIVPGIATIAEQALAGRKRVSNVFTHLRQNEVAKAAMAMKAAKLKADKKAAAELMRQAMATHQPPSELIQCGFAGVRAGM